LSHKESLVEIDSSVNSNCSLEASLLQRRRSLGEKPVAEEVLLVNTPSSLVPHPHDDYLSYDHNMPLGLV